MKSLSFIILFTIGFQSIWAQSYLPEYLKSSDLDWEWGASVKIAANISNKRPSLRIGMVVGAGTFILDKNCFPTAHLEWDVYVNGLGTRSSSPEKKNHLTTDLFTALTVTGRLGDYNLAIPNFYTPTWNQPLYYWTDFSQPPLQNPYWNSFSFGSVWAMSFDKRKIAARAFSQRIGFIDIHSNKADFSYSNDGGFGMAQSRLGDGYDRIYTGSGHFAYHPKTIDGANSYELSFHKFTGFSKNAFELSCELNLGFVDYSDSIQQYYSRSELCLRIGSTTQGWAGTLRWINPRNRREIQNFIHYSGDFAQHQISFPTGIALGADFSPVSTKLFLK